MSAATIRKLERNLWRIGVVRLLFSFHFVSAVLIPFFRDWGGLDYTRILSLNAWFMFWTFALEVPTGSVADRFGRRASIMLGGLVSGVGTLVMVTVPRLEIFMIAEFLLALGYALVSGADQALLYDSLLGLGREPEARRWFARLDSCKLTGIIGGALFGSPIAARFGLDMPVLLQAIPFSLCALFALTLVEAPAHGEPREAQPMRRLLGAGLRTIRKNASLRALVTDMVGTHALVFLIIWLYQPLIERAGVPLSYFGVVHAALCVSQIAILTRIGNLESWIGSRSRYLWVSAVLPGIAFLGLGSSQQVTLVVPAIMVAAGFGLTRSTFLTSSMNRYIDSAERATVLSSVSMLRMLAIAIINPIAGVLADWSLSGTLSILGVSAILVAVISRADARHLGDV